MPAIPGRPWPERQPPHGGAVRLTFGVIYLVWKNNLCRYNATNFPNIVKLADGLGAIGAKYNVSSGQVALAWLLAQGEDIIPIPGTKKLKVL
jgi:hypothetical protein